MQISIQRWRIFLHTLPGGRLTGLLPGFPLSFRLRPAWFSCAVSKFPQSDRGKHLPLPDHRDTLFLSRYCRRMVYAPLRAYHSKRERISTSSYGNSLPYLSRPFLRRRPNQKASFSSRYFSRSSILIRSCSMVSRSRTVTAPSFSESKS